MVVRTKPYGCENKNIWLWDKYMVVGTNVTTQDFIKFWGKNFAFVLLEMIGISQGFKTFESI
jgi:hypothetical protein